MQKITDYLTYIGANDITLDLFEGQYPVPDGVSYNSYLLNDERVVVFDTIDKRKTEDWLTNLKGALGGKKPNYLVISHMEPDHSASLRSFLTEYPDCTVVGNDKTFAIAERFFGNIFPNRLVVKDGDELALGKHILKFVFTPMVHWPEVMMTYEKSGKTLFSADAFGRFGAITQQPLSAEQWVGEARRYYINIVGKYGIQVQSALKKLSALPIERICPLHGPVLDSDLNFYLGKYDVWSSYRPEESGVLVAYATIYGNTAEAAELVAQMLRSRGVKVDVVDLARCDRSRAVSDAFRYDRLIAASSSYDALLLPVMVDFLHHLKIKNYQNRRVGIIENGSWAPSAAKVMRESFSAMKDITIAQNAVTVRSAVSQQTRAELEALADELAQ